MRYPTRRSIAVFAATMAIAGTATSAASAGWCKGGITVASARAKVGKVVRVKARVVSSYYARTSTGSPTFINLEYAYPDARRLTLLIWRENRANFPTAPERMFRPGRLVCAEGYLTRYRGAAQIEVSVWDAASRLISF